MPNEAMQNLFRLQQQMESMRGGDESGLITGPIRRRRREKREDAKFQEVAAAQQEADIFGREASIAASGINPQQMLPGQMQGLMGMPQAQFAAALDEIQAVQGANTPLTSMLASASAEKLAAAQYGKLIADEEDNLRGEYQKSMAPMVESRQALLMARSQLELGTPASAFNMGRLFTRQLDASMFASEELAVMIEQSGVKQQLLNYSNFIQGRGVFDEATRMEMLGAMDAIDEVLAQAGELTGQTYTGLVERSALQGMNPQNVVSLAGYGTKKGILTGQTGDDGGANTPEGPHKSGETITVDGVEYTVE